MTGYLKFIIPLTLLYVALTANVEPLNWVLGFLLAVAVVALVRPQPSAIPWTHLPRAVWAGLVFVLMLFWELIVSGFQVARIILRRDIEIRQGIIAIPDATEREWITTVSAEAITLTPGELVVEIGPDGTLYTHTLDVEKSLAEGVPAQEARARRLEEIAT